MTPRTTDCAHLAARAEALAQLLNAPELLPSAGQLAPMTHWLADSTWPDLSNLGPDGHPADGPEMIPETQGQRRMFAGSRTTLLGGLTVHLPVTHTSSLLSRQRKQGRTGPLTFVTIRHTYSQGERGQGSDSRVAVTEDVDLVYRPPVDVDRPSEPTAQDAGVDDLCRNHDRSSLLDLTVDPVTLFAFSALSHNPHRIHYDLPYAIAEGHRGLVVHGPLKILVMAVGLRRLGVRLHGRTVHTRLTAASFAPARLGVFPLLDDTGVALRNADGTTSSTATMS